MTIKVGDVGRPIYVATSFDLSANTALSLKFTAPDGVTTFTKNNPDVTAPGVDSPNLPPSEGFPGGILPANTYMLYTTVAGDFDTGGAGTWQVCGAYTDGTPKFYQGDDGPLVIEEAC